jgi:hypothetical protein
MPIVREPDGLAMSSRNVYLEPAQRREALVLVRALDAAEAAVASGERSVPALLECVRKQIGRAAHAEIDYAEIRDPATLAELARIEGPALLALAVRFPTTTPPDPCSARPLPRPSGNHELVSATPSSAPPDSCSARSGPRPSGIMNWVRLIDNRVLLAQPDFEESPR